MTDNYSDTVILQMISEADSKAFGFLYKKYFNMVRYLVEKNSGSSDDAADIFQEVLIIIYEKVRDNKLSLSCALKTYIYSVARNQWLKKLNKEKGKFSFQNFESYIEIESDEEDEFIAFPDINKLLNEIGEACRKLLILFYYRKKSMQEICNELNYANADTVKNQKYKCLQRLKKMTDSKA